MNDVPNDQLHLLSDDALGEELYDATQGRAIEGLRVEGISDQIRNLEEALNIARGKRGKHYDRIEAINYEIRKRLQGRQEPVTPSQTYLKRDIDGPPPPPMPQIEE